VSDAISVRTLMDLRLGLPEEGVRNLDRALRRAEAGCETDFRTPFYHAVDRNEIVSRMEGSVDWGKLPTELVDLESEEKKKIGPLSLRDKWVDLRDSLREYWVQAGTPSAKHRTAARLLVRSVLAQGLRPLALTSAYSAMPKGTSLGLPWASADRIYADSYLERARTATTLEDVYPALLFHRGQAAGPGKTKQRHVWGMDHVDTILGLSVMYPLLQELRRQETFAAWNRPDMVDNVMGRKIMDSVGPILSIDFKGFDHSLPTFIIDDVFDAICDAYQPAAHQRINLCRDIFLHVGMVTPDGVWEGRTGGVPSGTALTNMVDSLAHLWIIEYMSSLLGIERRWSLIMGDDGVHNFSRFPGVGAFATAAEEIGMTINPEKQWVSEDSVHFLQRWHSSRYIIDGKCCGVRPIMRTLSGMTGYERLRSPRIWSGWMDTVRWIMQAENCKHHPYFPQFVAFLRDGDRNLRSGVSIVEIFRRAGGASVIRDALGIEGFPYPSRQPELAAKFRVTAELQKMES